VVGLGAQDNFAYAQEFLDHTGVETPTMLWDPSFATWQSFGVQANSQMMILAPDLSSSSELIYGFSPEQQTAIVDVVSETWPTGS